MLALPPRPAASLSHRQAFVLTLMALIGGAICLGQSAYESVDPLIGTANGGNTFPGASLPFGMIQWSPDTGQGFYYYGDTLVHGFSLTHLSGAGCPVFGDMPILPWSTQPAADRTNTPLESLSFSHQDETAQPGFYSLKLADGTLVELAVTDRAGMARLHFAEGHHAGLLVNAAGSASSDVHMAKLAPVGREHDGESLTLAADGTLYGTVTSGGFCGSDTRYTLHIALQLQRPAAKVALWQDGRLTTDTSAQGKRASAWLDLGEDSTHLLKVGLSYVSQAKAKANLDAEIPGWDFEQVHQAARDKWIKSLATIEITGGTKNERTIFYTALYHNLLAPSLFSDVDGEYQGFDQKPHKVAATQSAQYTNFSDWDTYRDTTPMQALIAPEQAGDMAQSLLNDAAQMGSLPRWAIANDSSYVMGGDAPEILIAEYYAFGAANFDQKAALAVLKKGATEPGLGIHKGLERVQLAEYVRLGYLPESTRKGDWDISASETLEIVNADFAVSEFARAMGDTEFAATMAKRSGNWRNLLDPDSRWIRPRYANGEWQAGFDADKLLPHTVDTPDPTDQLGFQEGNTYQYTFMLPFDYAGLFKAIGDESTVEYRLDTFFRKLVCEGEPCYNATNEPDYVTPFAYTFLGKPSGTASVVTRIEDETFSTTPGGLAGNDDLGATSGVYLWNALGMYPCIPGAPGVVLGTPRFAKAILHLQHGKTLEIERRGSGIYVQSVTLNETDHPSSWLPLTELRPGANRLVFHLGPDSRSKWATAPEARPPSLSTR